MTTTTTDARAGHEIEVAAIRVGGVTSVIPPSPTREGPRDIARRLRSRKEVLERHAERARQTLVAPTGTGWIVVAHPNQPEQWAKATDPDGGPEYLRTQMGILDPETVIPMCDAPGCMPGNPWTEADEAALVEAEQAVADQLARQRAEAARQRPEMEAEAARIRAAHRVRAAEVEARWGRLVSP